MPDKPVTQAGLDRIIVRRTEAGVTADTITTPCNQEETMTTITDPRGPLADEHSFGTVSMLVYPHTVEVSADTDIRDADWQAVCDELAKLGIDDPGEPVYDRGVNSWVIGY
jgi:hypothetical protein